MRHITEELLDLPTIHPNNTIGVLLSGGMDSALLLYLLAKYTPNSISCFTVKKHDGADMYVDGIVNWINQKLNKTIPFSLRVGNPNLHHEQIIVNALYLIKNECDIFYLAGNSYPEDVLPGGPRRTRVVGNTIKQPFFDCYKTDIVQAYIDYDLMDLLPYTHTCTEQSIGRCHMCWQCKERSWAFEELNLIDKTTT